jgi:hypothetical protein
VATSPKVEGVTGQYFNPIGVKGTTSALAQDTALQAKLWDVSMDLTKSYE